MGHVLLMTTIHGNTPTEVTEVTRLDNKQPTMSADQRIIPMALRVYVRSVKMQILILVLSFNQNRFHQNENLLHILFLLC